MLRLSIIIPFYNVEKYIAECLDSVFDQDIPMEEYEVICVNDGSPDRSRDIVLDYMKRYPNLKLVEHDHNRKLGAARNTGRRSAKGKYIWNVDSDDKIAPNCLGEMLRKCEENDLDVLEFGTVFFQGEKQQVMPHVPSTEHVVRGLEYLESLNQNGISRMCPVWRKMIKRAFLDENQIFSPEINMGEDVPYSFRTLLKAQRLFVTDEIYYHQRINPKSLTGSGWKPTVAVLYEKSFVNSKMIAKIVSEVPKQYANVRSSILSVARYTWLTVEKYYPVLQEKEKSEFRVLCRKDVWHHGFLFKILSSRRIGRYMLWILGLNNNFVKL